MSQRYLGGIITTNPTAPTLTSASGVWTLEQQFQYAQTIQPALISRSVRLRSSASAYFSRTPASASNRKTWTYSCWFKRGTLGAGQRLFRAYGGTTDADNTSVGIDSSDRIEIGGHTVNWRVTTAVYRDPSAWMHLVFVVNTPDATANNRIRIYVNGVEITAFTTLNNPSQNADLAMNSAVQHLIGANNGPSSPYTDGYLTEINFIDGQALTPSSFGGYDSTGVWQPLPYTGTYGTNGFYLNFSDPSAATAAAIGKDYSGNGNNWTPNNISVTSGTTYDSMIDVPTPYADGGNGRGNYCVLNPLRNSMTLSNANLTFSATGNPASVGTIGVTSGKWYWEITPTSSQIFVGLIDANSSTAVQLPSTANSWSYYAANGSKYSAPSGSGAYGASYGNGDIVGVAFDADAGTLVFYKNNVSQGTAYSGLTSGPYFPAVSSDQSGVVGNGSINFGQRPFAYTPPTGFVALNTQNLPTPTITNGANYMAATLYTGTGASNTISNGNNNTIGTTFQPDLVWIKSRSAATDHKLTDAVRGTTKGLISNTTGAETTDTNGLTAFNSNGFTVGTDTVYNNNTATYVAWQWKESATAGFDIIKQTLATTGTNTITHSLGVVPTMVIAKRTDGVEAWLVYQSSVTTQSQYLSLNSTAAVASSANLWGSSAFTSSQFYFTGTSGVTYVFYAFAPVMGYSAFGSYTGNGSTDGTFVYCGFRPRFIMYKRTDTTGNWNMLDTTRSTFNVSQTELVANQSIAEFTSANANMDVNANGFKLRTTDGDRNASGGTYIYMAFAENPFKTSRAR